MQVIATAGHVDHGKSTLVRALTGMEPDRWAEERRRGMTIDLGYAWTTLASGEEVAFVDVPGHERFATNMLAGIGPVPAVLLVIAADGGWAAQTEEHVRALHALGVRHGVVAVTRSDLADPAAAVRAARERLATTTLVGVPVAAVSGTTGAGVAELRSAIDEMLAGLPAPDPDERVRLWLDRCFTIRGSGTVVTGTLGAGTLHRGDSLDLNGRAVSVRDLQRLGQTAETVTAPARVAVNLRGVAAAEVHRGDTLLSPRLWRPTAVVDVRADLTATPTRVMVHVGSAAVPGRLRVLSDGCQVVRLSLSSALPLRVGDRLLIRDPGRRQLLGGATVLDPAPPSLRRRGAARERAAQLAEEDGSARLERELQRRGAAPRALLAAIGVPLEQPLPASAVEAAGWLVDRATWTTWLGQLAATVEGHAGSTLLDAGVSGAEIARRLDLPDSRLVSALVRDRAGLEEVAGHVRRRGAAAALRDDLAAAVVGLSRSLRADPFRAPEQPQLAQLGLGRRELGAAAAAGAILRLPGEIVLLPDAAERAVQRLRELPQPFTVSQARQALATTRRVAVPLLEHLDGIRATERVSADLRRLRVGG